LFNLADEMGVQRDHPHAALNGERQVEAVVNRMSEFARQSQGLEAQRRRRGDLAEPARKEPDAVHDPLRVFGGAICRREQGVRHLWNDEVGSDQSNLL
jgi:hypothetical protein